MSKPPIGKRCYQHYGSDDSKVGRDGSTCVVNINQQHPERRRDEKSPSKPSIHWLSKEDANKEDDQTQQGPSDR